MRIYLTLLNYLSPVMNYLSKKRKANCPRLNFNLPNFPRISLYSFFFFPSLSEVKSQSGKPVRPHITGKGRLGLVLIRCHCQLIVKYSSNFLEKKPV